MAARIAISSCAAAIVTVAVYRAMSFWIRIDPAEAGQRETRCRKCGYILRGLTEPRCPECGESI
jgi:rubrerythrin